MPLLTNPFLSSPRFPRLNGLGASCSGPTLTPAQIYQTAIAAGFPPSVATQMVAIALRESGGCASAVNVRAPGTSSTTDPGETSYGLWQINTAGNPQFVGWDLSDPNVNAQAAYRLYGGNPNNLNIAWYINRPGYQQNYEKYLPIAEQAALDSGASSGDLPTIDDSPDFLPVNAGSGSGGVDWATVGVVAGAVVLGLMVMGEL